MPKLYGYTYAGSALAARRPMTTQQMLDTLNDSLSPEKFEVFELVPVKVVTKTVIALETK